jgi:P4 family phage/plasmid primase-like protien
MNTLTGGDRGVRQLLEEFCGVCLSNIPGWRLKKALFMYGPGDTGKSVLKTLVEHLLGKGNYIGIDLAEIEARFGTGSIYGKRLAGSSDMSFLTVAELKTFKKCTGGDSLFAEFKGQQSFAYTYGGLLWFCMNRLPKFGGDDGKWVYERIVQVLCSNVIPPDKQDKRLLDKLLNEREGILHRMVMALQRVIASGYRLSEPASVREERAAYQQSNSTVITFFQDCMQPLKKTDKHHLCTAMKVYTAYQGWCRDNNRGYAKTAREFKEELAAHLCISPKDLTVRHKEGMVYRSYTLTREAAETYLRGCSYQTADEEFLALDPVLPDYLN